MIITMATHKTKNSEGVILFSAFRTIFKIRETGVSRYEKSVIVFYPIIQNHPTHPTIHHLRFAIHALRNGSFALQTQTSNNSIPFTHYSSLFTIYKIKKTRNRKRLSSHSSAFTFLLRRIKNSICFLQSFYPQFLCGVLSCLQDQVL